MTTEELISMLKQSIVTYRNGIGAAHNLGDVKQKLELEAKVSETKLTLKSLGVDYE